MEASSDIILDRDEHKVTEIKCELEENTMTRQIHSEMLKDVGKRVHEEDPTNEESSITNNKNKKRRRSIAIEAGKKAESVVPSDVEIDEYTCPHCLKRFDGNKKKKKHLRQVHKITSRGKTKIMCNECNVGFPITNKLRLHLREVHDMRMTEEEFSFPNMEAFKIWKLNLERKEAVYFSQHAGQRTKKQSTRYNYVCNRSGTYRPQPKGPKSRRIKFRGSCKMGSYCTAAISCLKSNDGVQVKYWPQHYGHTKDISSELLSGTDQSILEAESITGGDSLNDLLKDVRINLTSESILPSATKKRDKQILEEAFESVEYNSGLSDSESVDHWVHLCLQMEESPVLFYRQEELSDGGEEFLLIIMTEFQKQLLMSSEKKVICVDCVHRRKGGRFYLTCISIVDECNVAFPVAFCISNKVDEHVVRQFLMSVRKSTGPLSCTYFMSDSENFYFDAWNEIMNDSSKWLWSMWYMDYNVQIKLRNYFNKSDFEKKFEIYRTIRTLIECHSQIIFELAFKKFLDSLLIDQLTPVKKFGDVVSKKYSLNVERWAYCYRTEMKTSSSFQLDALHRTLRFCCTEGRKTRLDKFIFVLMKFVKRKMLDRLMNILDDEKIEMVRETINMCHKAGLDISPQNISSLSDKIWLIKSADEENMYVVRDFDSCPENCMMRCADCDICVHMYSCSCIPSMINANLCQHIHAIVWKFLTPHHFSPMPSPTHDDNTESDGNNTSTARNNCPEILESILNMAHEIYKSVRENKGNLSNEELTLIKWRLSEAKECIDVCTGKKIPLNAERIIQQVPFLPHLDLPPSSQNSILRFTSTSKPKC